MLCPCGLHFGESGPENEDKAMHVCWAPCGGPFGGRGRASPKLSGYGADLNLAEPRSSLLPCACCMSKALISKTYEKLVASWISYRRMMSRPSDLELRSGLGP